MLFEATLQQGLEGIVSKRLTSRYVFGERTRNWLKFAHRHRRSYVVGGWRPQEGTTDRLAALLVGEPTADGLVYRGRVGSGIGAAASRSLTDAGRPDRAARTARSPTRCPGSTPAARSGSSRCSWSTWRPTASATPGSASRRTAASAPTWPRRPVGAPRDRRAAVVVAVAPADAARRPAPSTLDGVPVHLRPGTEQVVTVNHTEGYHARVTFWKLTDTGWRARFASRRRPDRVRRPGARHQAQAGHRHHPARHLPAAVGLRHWSRRDERWRLRYREVESGDFWVQDNASAYYNRYRNQAEGGFRWWLPQATRTARSG